MVPKTTIDLDVISKIPADRFVIQQNLSDDDDNNNNDETSHISASDYLSSKRIEFEYLHYASTKQADIFTTDKRVLIVQIHKETVIPNRFEVFRSDFNKEM